MMCRFRHWLTAAGLICSAAAGAHPHSFIALKTQLVVENGQLTGLAMAWTMDELTSADLLYDAADVQADSPVWKKLAAEVMANVIAQHYFTEFWRGSEKVTFTPRPPQYSLARSGHQAVLRFVLPLAHPQPLAGQRYRFATFDPSYFVDMHYAQNSDLSLPAQVPPGCKITLTTPEPTAELLAYAQALDKTDTPDREMNLGEQFAQQVVLQCP